MATTGSALSATSRTSKGEDSSRRCSSSRRVTETFGEAEAPAIERPRVTSERTSPAPRQQPSPPPEQKTEAVARAVPVEPQFMPPPPPSVDRARLKLEVLVYSEVAAKRLVFINGRKYVEGESIEGRLKVVEIKEDGVVLSDDGRPFTLR